MTLFEDRDVIVLNKPYGLAVQGGSGTKRHIDGMLEALADKDGTRPVLVHRLDRDTSGVLLVAKSRKMAAELGEIFRSRGAKKIYWALVEGVPKPAQGRISMFLAKGEGMGEERGRAGTGRADIERMRVAKHGEKDAQHSLTLYAVVDKVAPRLAWLSMRPITGRTHQLRAHCEAIGHPIVGDPKYNRKPANDPARNDPLRAVPPGIEPKLHLFARRLILPHPRGGVIDVTAPLPEHMKKSFDMFGFERARRAIRSRTRPMSETRRRTRCARRGPTCGRATVRRFYRTVDVREVEGGGICADCSTVASPGRPAATGSSSRAGRSCRGSRKNGRRQGETIDPADMPITRLLNSAIDGVARTMDETRADIVRYAGSDLLCYRADAPGGAGRAPAPRFRSDARLGGRDARRALQCSRPASSMSNSRRRRWPRCARRSRRSTIRRRSRRLASSRASPARRCSRWRWRTAFLRLPRRGAPRMSTRTSRTSAGASTRRRGRGARRGWREMEAAAIVLAATRER